MEKVHITVFLAALVFVVLELPSCEAGCRGGGGAQCVTDEDCTDGYICVNGTCKRCLCRLASECYVDASGNVLCNCTEGYHGPYCYCQDCEPCPQPNNCEMGWEFFEGHCYLYVSDVASHRDAQFHCKNNHQAYLVTVESAAEHNFLFNDLAIPASITTFVIGGAYVSPAYFWQVVSSLVQENPPAQWATGYPGSIEGCMAYELQLDSTWKWIALSDDGSQCTEFQTVYVCEKEEPSSVP